MKMNGKIKKLIIGLGGICLSAVIFTMEIMTNISDVQAKTNVLEQIKEKYKAGCKFTILEIEPDKQAEVFNFDESNITVSKHAELGYFFPTSVRRSPFKGDGFSDEHTSIARTCYGSVFGSPATRNDDATYPKQIYDMRTYGLIKPDGLDSQGLTNRIGEYPLFGESAIFSIYWSKQINQEYNRDESYAKGVYSLGTGDYQLRDGCSIDEMGRICTVSINEIPDPNASVSDDTIPMPTIEQEILTPVEDIDTTKLQLPASTDGTPYVTRVSDGTGNLIFTRTVAPTTLQEYYGLSDLALYYTTTINGKYYNSDWFREYVFGNSEEFINKNSIINYITKAASEVTVSDIENADLIYINGTNQAFKNGKCDLTDDVTTALYNEEVLKHRAIMMDYAGFDAGLNNNISKLALLLWQESQDSLISQVTGLGATEFKSLFSTQTDPTTGDAVYKLLSVKDLFKKTEIINKLSESVLEGGNGNFVSGNVYVYNHHMTDFLNPKSMVDALDIFSNGDFTSAYTAEVTSKGFNEVLEYINYTNKKSYTSSMPSYVSPAVAIQYILVGDGKGLTVVKSSLNVLEIQPSMVFLYNDNRGSEKYQYLTNDKVKKNRDDFVSQYLSSYYNGKPEYIDFVSMSIDEFNGRNEDLIENYDIIFIGTETGIGTNNSKYYSVKAKSNQYVDNMYRSYGYSLKSIDVPKFKDKNMTGNVYYNIGDKVTGTSELLGWTDKDKTGKDQRYAGRDLTNNKLTKLKEYLDADNLILVEHDMLGQVNNKGTYMINPSAVDPKIGGVVDLGRVDTSSNMYELLKYARGERFNRKTGKYTALDSDSKAFKIYDNLISVGDLSESTLNLIDKEVVNKYLATEKLSLTVNKAPKEYTYEYDPATKIILESSIQYLEQNPDGTRDLTYEFYINSDLTDASIIPTYRPHLYIDINNDGKYSKSTEDIKDIVITANGAEAPKDENNDYVLNKDVVYTLKRSVSSEYSGLIKWKLDVQSIQYENSHASEQGNTLAANITKQDKQIKILQINRNSGSTLNLQTELEKSGKYGKYLTNVPGYEVIIKTITVDQFENDFKNKYTAEGAGKTAQEYALQYFNTLEISPAKDVPDGKGNIVHTDAVYGANMLVLGFGDNYDSFNTDNAITAVDSFMKSGKPVLLSHDFIMFRHNNKQASLLRNIVGMDVFGVTQDIQDSVIDGQLTYSLAHKNASTSDLNVLHTGVEYSVSANINSVRAIENTGKRVAFVPGKEREITCEYTQGFSNFHIARYKDSATADGNIADSNLWIANNQVDAKGFNGASDYKVIKLNDGQITTYPYLLPENFTVSLTHGQYFQLDMDADDDNDGESDVVVWYTLGDSGRSAGKLSGKATEKTGDKYYNPWSDKVAGPCPADGYYIYNKGNVTYTGAGHGNMSDADTEAQLFVNTLFAAFQAGYVPPTINFYEKPDLSATPINGFSVPYDKNVTNPDGSPSTLDSSILKDDIGNYKYKFVDPNTDPSQASNGTPVFFRLTDDNFVRGTKQMRIKYYLKADGYNVNDTITLPNGTALTVMEITPTGSSAKIPVVDISQWIRTYNVSGGKLNTEIPRNTTTHYINTLESGVTYGLYLPLTLLNNNGAFTLILETQTTINTVSALTGKSTSQPIEELGYQDLTVTKTDLLKLD